MYAPKANSVARPRGTPSSYRSLKEMIREARRTRDEQNLIEATFVRGWYLALKTVMQKAYKLSRKECAVILGSVPCVRHIPRFSEEVRKRVFESEFPRDAGDAKWFRSGILTSLRSPEVGRYQGAATDVR